MLKRLLASYVVYPIAEKREGRQIRPKLKELYEHYSHNFLYREALLKKKLYEQVALAEKTVPYYRDLFKAIKFDVTKLEKDTRYLSEIPFIDKNIILDQGDRLLNETIKGQRLYPCKTGGSTGQSVIIQYDQAAADWSAATTLYARELCGNKRHSKELHLSSELPVIRNKKDQFREDIKCLAMNRTNVYYKTFSDAEMDRILSEIKAENVHLVHGHPSTMYCLAVHAEKVGLKKKIFSVFESSGEYLPPHKKAFIEKVFQCRVINRYGLAEAGVIAYQPNHEIEDLLVFDHMVYPETVLDELVITNLKNQAMPLIRYKTGDLGDVVRTDQGLMVHNLRGRVHDSVTINNTVYLTHYVQDILDRFGGVTDFQIVQSQSKPILRVVPNEHMNKQAFEESLRGVWQDGISIEYIDYSALQLVGRRSKFRYVVNV